MIKMLKPALLGALIIVSFATLTHAKKGLFGSSTKQHEAVKESKDQNAPTSVNDPANNQLPEDIIFGSPDAPLDVIVYGAFTCSHCAQFHLDIIPILQKEYVHSGKIRLITRDFPMDKASLAATVIARSGNRETYLRLAHTFFEKHESIIDHKNPLDYIKQIAVDAGMSRAQVDRALANKALEDKVLNGVVYALNHYKIEATPTVIVGKTTINYAPELDELKETIENEIKNIHKSPISR